jgi:hypothetical protein
MDGPIVFENYVRRGYEYLQELAFDARMDFAMSPLM